MARNPELEAKLIEDPDDIDAHLVYADFLQTHGDPRGELITLFHRGKLVEAEAFMEAHAGELYGPLKKYRTTFDGSNQRAFEWRLGFIRSARFSYDSNSAEEVELDEDDDGELALEDGLAALLQHPSGALLEELVIPINMIDDGAYFEPLVKALATNGAPALRKLRIGEFVHAGPGGADDGYEYEISWTSIGDASGLWKAVPRLERLVLQVGLGGTSASGGNDVLGDIDLPALKHLEVITGGMSQSCLQSLANAKLPSLTYMDLWMGDSGYGFEGGVEDLEPLLDGSHVPKLQHLGLLNSELTDDICARLGESKVLPRLTELSLAYGTMTDAGARALADHKDAFAHLKVLDLRGNCLSSEGIAAVETLCPEVITEEQKSPDERYVSLSE